jgi:Rps23 Pro-64 3,4-dihydroxylase Tpa1-like proline 4-hydroxylase
MYSFRRMWPSWSRRLPLLRTYEALRVAQERLAATKEELRRARDERDLARNLHAHVISHGRIKDLAREHTETYRVADPFPHAVIDNFLDPQLLEGVLGEFDAMDRALWHYTERDTERKYSTEDFRHFGPTTRALITQLNAAPFLAFLESLTGIAGLIPDPHLRGGGLHEIRRGGALGVHADFNFYERLNLYRRLNLLIYLNETWPEAWGGELELWDRSGTRCVQRIAPIFNRAVLFDTSNFSYHGHPRPLECPEERSRKSVALYYYTVDAPPDDNRTPHTTVFLQTEGVAARVPLRR